MENIIQFITVMFMLSIICERVAEFFKNYLCGRKVSKYFLVGDTLTKYPPHSLRETRRQYRVFKLNLVIGFVTAFLCHASFFSILQNLEDPGKVIGWPNTIVLPPMKDWFRYISFATGCFLTGAFISLGSKFWHDLLDIVKEIKQAKRTLTEQRKAETTGLATTAFTLLPPDQQVSLIEAAIAANSEKWINTIPNVTGVGVGNKITADQSLPQKVIRFEVSVKENIMNTSELIPKLVTFGQYELPTDVVTAGNFSLQYAHPGDDATPRKCGASVSRGNNNSESTGTISLKVKRTEGGVDRFYLLTCAHVVMNDELQKGITRINRGDTVTQPVVISPGRRAKTGGTALGNLVEGVVSNHTDSALVELLNPQILDERLYNIGKVGNRTRAIDETDVDKTRVKFTGAYSGLVKDVLIKGYGLNKQGDYPSGPVMLKNLITLERCSNGGDSGAVVMDEKNAVIGLVVGASGLYTYVIPIQSVKSAHKQFTII